LRDKVLKEIFEQVASELDMNLEEVKAIHDSCWESTISYIETGHLPTILLPKFGRMIPSQGRLRRKIEKGKANDTLQASYDRIVEEQRRRKRKKNETRNEDKTGD